MSNNFGKYAAIYDALNVTKDYKAEAAYLIRRIRSTGTESTRPLQMLEVGCGTGRHAVEIARQLDCHITGVDTSEEMIDNGRLKLASEPSEIRNKIALSAGRLDNVSVEKHFDVVYMLFHVASYVAADVGLSNLLSQASSRLAPGGVIFFDYWHAPAVKSDQPTVRIRRALDSKGNSIVRIAEPTLDSINDNVTVDFTFYIHNTNQTITHFRESHKLHFFDANDLQELALANGFQSQSHHAWLKDYPPTTADWYADFCAKKA